MQDAGLLITGAEVKGSAMATRLSNAGADVAALAIRQILTTGVLQAV